MTQVTTLILAALATARITRLVTTDRLTLAPRRWLLRRLTDRYGDESVLAYLIVCDWCVSVYAAAGVTGAWVKAGDTLWFQAPAAALALSYAAGWLASKESEE
jgi:hypothetical protein